VRARDERAKRHGAERNDGDDVPAGTGGQVPEQIVSSILSPNENRARDARAAVERTPAVFADCLASDRELFSEIDLQRRIIYN
jgi:hypothetical protein